MKYGLKKFATMLITILCISFLVYLAFDVIPGDAALAALGTDVEPERLAALREEMGLNRPFLERYFDLLVSLVRGDFCTSYKNKLRVTSGRHLYGKTQRGADRQGDNGDQSNHDVGAAFFHGYYDYLCFRNGFQAVHTGGICLV